MEHVALLDVGGALTPGQRPGVEGNVADEVEGVEVFVQFLGNRIELQTLNCQLIDNGLLALGGLPAPEEVVQAGEAFLESFLGEVTQGFGDELAVLIHIGNPLGNDGGTHAIDINLVPSAIWGRVREDIIGGVISVRRRRIVLVRRRDGVVLSRLINLNRLAVELRIGEVVGGAPEIHQREVEFAGVLMHAGSAPQDLLELGHGADLTVEHDQAAGLDIDPGGEQPRGGDQHGMLGFRIDEVAQLRLALGIAAGDAHDVAVVPVHQVGVFVDERLPHTGGVFLVHAEDDRLLEAIAAFLQIPGDLASHQLGAFVQDQSAVEVLEVVETVFDLVAVPVELPLLGAVAFHVPVDMDLDDLVGRQEAVCNALFQGIGIERLSEVVDVGNVTGFLGCGRQADLGGRGKVFQDLSPGRILGGAAPVALVDHDQVEEARGEFAENLAVFLRPGDCLVEAEVNLVGGVDAALFTDGSG